MPTPETVAALARLEADGLLRATDAGPRTTRRWQGAMMRAAARLLASGETSDDLRLPVSLALVELYGDRLSPMEVVEMVYVLVPIEARELSPSGVPSPPLEGTP